MSNKNKETETQVPVESTPKVEEPVRNSRCAICNYCNVPSHVGSNVGENSTATVIKLRWHQTFFDREMEVLTSGQHRYFWAPRKGVAPLSLKQFAKGLAEKKDQLAKDWLAHKHGSLNTECSDKNKSRILQESQASKAARKKKKASGGKAASDAAALATVGK